VTEAAEGAAGSPRSPNTLWLGRVLGPAFLVATLVLPPPGDLGPDAWRVAGLALFMATWWVTEVIPIPVTALLPLPLLPLLQISSVEAAAAPFANPVIFLFMGGFMIAQAMQRWNLHRRIAFRIIRGTGTAPLRLVAGFMAASAFLSMWVSNTAVAVMMLPIGISVIQVLGRGSDEDGPTGERGAAAPRSGELDRPFAVALLLGIAYGCSIGGVATLIGTPPNALLAGFLAEDYGIRIGFAQWMMVGLPLTLVLLPLTWVVLTRVAFRVDPRGRSLSPALFQELQAHLGRISSGERRVAWVFAGTAAAWILRPLVERWVPGLTDAGIAMGATLVLFLLPAGRSEDGAVLNWEWAKRIPWDVLLLFGGGLSLAAAITGSGLAGWIGEQLRGADQLPLLGLLLVVSAVIIFLTELTSNTASAAAFLPILAALALTLGRDPLFLTVPAALAASCAFMLPVATPPNAIVFGSGSIRMHEMVRAGFLLNLLVIILVPVMAFLAVRFVLGIPLDLPAP
jgi:solute carrier family 13 (sodium-dependent dicarboxylate transporter), member 2/3/5